MDFERKIRVGNLAEAQDYPEDRLIDVLSAVRVKLDSVAMQCCEIDEVNAELERQIQAELAEQAKLHEQTRVVTDQIASAKDESAQMNDQKLELKKQIRASNQEAIFFQGQAEILKNSLRRDIQLLTDREKKQKVISKREQEVF